MDASKPIDALDAAEEEEVVGDVAKRPRDEDKAPVEAADVEKESVEEDDDDEEWEDEEDEEDDYFKCSSEELKSIRREVLQAIKHERPFSMAGFEMYGDANYIPRADGYFNEDESEYDSDDSFHESYDATALDACLAKLKADGGGLTDFPYSRFVKVKRGGY